MNSPVEQSSWMPEHPYVSGRCTIGTHDWCRDAEPRDSGVPGVSYLVCTCSCHRPSLALVKAAST